MLIWHLPIFFVGVVNGKINSKFVDIQNTSLQEFIVNAGYNINRIAVEINGNIIPKNKYETTQIIDGDEVEIVHFVGGG